ncbi:uncharacterized protein TNCV_4274131 [Trichonephila clavipes]|nr:uncharacterized protein TNCV_4274131 [Trichonephila clavipes]
MSSAGYSASPVHSSRWSPSILAWLQSKQASLAATPSQWRHTPKKSCPVVRRKRTSALSRCLGIGPTVARVSHDFPKLSVLWVKTVYLSMCGVDAFCSSEGQGDFRFSQLGSLFGLLVGSFITGDPNMTWDPL